MVGLTAQANEDRPMAGIGLMLVAYLAFSMIDTSAKWLSLAGLPVFQLVFIRYAGHAAISLALILRGGVGWGRFATASVTLVALRSGLLAASTVLNFIALRYIPLTLTSTILFSAPLMICALSYPLLGERVGPWRWTAILVGFAGLLIAIRPFGAEFHWAASLSLVGAVCFAFYSILTRRLAGHVATDTMQFYAGALGTLLVAPFAFTSWQNPRMQADWAALAALGLFGWLGHQLMTRAHGYAAASTLTPFTYSFVVYITLWSWLLFDEAPDGATMLGAAIIVASGLFIWWRERGQARMPAPPR